MKHFYPQAVRIDSLVVGDVVRALHGPCTGKDYSGPPEIGGPDDFREGYDVMAVVAISEDGRTLTFERPYLHPGGIGRGSEKFDAFRDHKGLWYEKLHSSPGTK